MVSAEVLAQFSTALGVAPKVVRGFRATRKMVEAMRKLKRAAAEAGRRVSS
jgi:hypothetical protein